MSCYDRGFMADVLHIIEDYDLSTFPHDVFHWYDSIHWHCAAALETWDETYQWVNLDEFFNTVQGEFISAAINQYRYDETFDYEITRRLGQCADQRDRVIQNHRTHHQNLLH